MTPSVWRIGLPMIREEIVLYCKQWFSNLSISCGCCWWKLLVCVSTLIYCGQLCHNAVNYPSTPLSVAVSPTRIVQSRPFSTYHPVTGSRVRLTTLIPVYARIRLIFGLFKTQLTVSVKTEVILLGVKLKVSILSIHSWKVTSIACFVREVIAYECTHVGASEKKRYL
jgi:hypothetical protein